MPNWPLSAYIRNYLRNQIREVAHRPVELARLNMPLTVDQIQEGGLGLTHEQLDTLKTLWSQNVRTIDRTSEIRLAFLQEQFPELRRGIVVKLVLPKVVFTGRATMYGMGVPRFSMSDSHYIVPKFDNLSSEERASLIKWLERLLRQERIFEVVGHCVHEIVENDKRAPSIAHLQAIWPAAGSVIDASTARYRHEQQTIREWKERFRNPPLRNLQLYTPDTAFMTKWTKLIKLADVQLAQGMMLESPKLERGGIGVEVEAWQRIEGDITF